jgi:hypothetical protein
VLSDILTVEPTEDKAPRVVVVVVVVVFSGCVVIVEAVVLIGRWVSVECCSCFFSAVWFLLMLFCAGLFLFQFASLQTPRYFFSVLGTF